MLIWAPFPQPNPNTSHLVTVCSKPCAPFYWLITELILAYVWHVLYGIRA